MLIPLQEWDKASDVSLTFEQVDALRRAAGSAIEIRPGSRRDRWDIQTRAYVGAIRTSHVTVMIRPKVSLENLFYMLSAAQADVDFGTSLVGFEEDELLPALAAFYERLVAHTLRRGVLKSYQEHHETLVALRGRIDIPATLRTGGMPAPIPCRFDELSVDIPENQILRTAALALARLADVAADVRRNLRRVVGSLDGVRAVDPRALPPINFTRLNRHYEPALRVAEVILRSGGIRDRAGSFEASAFLIDMNQLFEDFVTRQLRRHLAGKLEVRAQELTHLDVGRKIRMYPDLVFYRNREPVLVADIKYKLTDDGVGRHADYYQLLAYCRALDIEFGVLIYAADHTAFETEVLMARGGPRLALHQLNSEGGSANVCAAVRSLSDSLLAATTPATPVGRA